MTNPSEPPKSLSVPAEAKIEPTGNDPTPENRRGDSRFLPVVILAGIALIVILIAGILVIRSKGHKIIPAGGEHPTSSLVVAHSRIA